MNGREPQAGDQLMREDVRSTMPASIITELDGYWPVPREESKCPIFELSSPKTIPFTAFVIRNLK